MIDFKNASYAKLKEVRDAPFLGIVEGLLLQDERILGVYQGIRDGVVITNARLVVVNVQGMTGKKKDFSSLPFSKVQAFSVETAGMLDIDSELELWFSGLGKVKLEFTSNTDIIKIGRIIGNLII